MQNMFCEHRIACDTNIVLAGRHDLTSAKGQTVKNSA